MPRPRQRKADAAQQTEGGPGSHATKPASPEATGDRDIQTTDVSASATTPQDVANMADKLDSAHKKEAAVNLVDALAPEDKSEVVARVVGNLETPDQKKEAAVAAVGALPSAATPDVVATMVGKLDSADQKRAAAAALNTLPQDQQQQVASSILGTSSPKVQGALWLIVIMTISVAIFVFGVLSFVLVVSGKSAEGPLALATTALGGIVGLVASTPGRRG
jgi:hypothetical protein